jgi:NADH-quinone oxidoreductase subunit N
MSAVSLYYYLQVLKQVYVAEAAASPLPITVSGPALAAIVLLAVGVVVLGALPDLLLGPLRSAAKLAGF